MSTLVVALLSFAIAFIAGALLSKAFFATQSPKQDMVARKEHHALLKAQRSRYRKRVHALSNVVRLHEETQGKIKEKLAEYHQAMEARAESSRVGECKIVKLQTELTELRNSLANNDGESNDFKSRIAALEVELKAERAKSASASNELGLLRIEREELTARVQRLEQEQRPASQAELDPTYTLDEPAAEMRAGMGELREKLAARDRCIHELNVQLEDSDAQKKNMEKRLATLRQRISPLTQKLRQQRQLIRQLRELSANSKSGNAAATKQPDDLKAIRGIGPALERRLHSHGIERFEQIAAMSEKEFVAIAARLSIAPTLAQRQGWIQQARDLYRELDHSS